MAVNDPGQTFFAHERLEVYRQSILFVAWLSDILEEVSRCGDAKDQLDRASTSIPLNIAEGNGKFTLKDRCHFFDIAHGSVLECAAALDVLVAKNKLTLSQVRSGKERLQQIVNMLMGLLKRNSARNYPLPKTDASAVLAAGAPGDSIDLAAKQIDPEHAAELRDRLKAFEEDWNSPGMDVYNSR